MIKIYGTPQCPDCMACESAYKEAGIEYKYFDIRDLRVLKRFLKMRDEEPVFNEAKKMGAIGVPLVVKEDGSLTIDWKEILVKEQ